MKQDRHPALLCRLQSLTRLRVRRLHKCNTDFLNYFFSHATSSQAASEGFPRQPTAPRVELSEFSRTVALWLGLWHADLYCQIASAVTRQADWAVVRYIGYRTSNRRCHLKLVKRNLVSIFKQQFLSDLNFSLKNIVLNIDANFQCSAFDGIGCSLPCRWL